MRSAHSPAGTSRPSPRGVPALAPTVYLPSSQSRFLPSDTRLAVVWLPIYVPYLFQRTHGVRATNRIAEHLGEELGF